ncbi:hypothetical protein EDC44_10723 [Cricetibacter osteomyelitidis]|uniref:DNA gyrase inhibitor YacG n=1 Tax=Cricetibacter osteomyelitidis TaxID=1521931 RepID=A0A4R2T4I0_9PAST|nr:DNA gyrase inhibitor YacG [Cricetibacter osteomyelitidis]TCP95744.1 hypothetical protein EDC44_10723 [Cricetibacter osteomyelitidis]
MTENTDNELISVPCPTCGTAVEWSAKSEFRPFCSKRCQIIDLGDWAAEKNAIPTATADFAIDPQLDDSQDWAKN